MFKEIKLKYSNISLKREVTFFLIPYKCPNNKQKQHKMKFVKFSVFALALGFFAVSCNNETATTETTTTNDSAATVVAPPVEATPVTTADTTATSTTTTTAAGDTTTKTTTEVKH